MSLRPCSSRGDGSLPFTKYLSPALGPWGLALIIPKLYSMVPPIYLLLGHSTCMFTIESHLISLLLVNVFNVLCCNL